MEDGSSRGRGGGAHGLLNQLIKLTYELATENGQKWGAEAGNRTLGLGNSNSVESAWQKEKVVRMLLARPTVISASWKSCHLGYVSFSGCHS